jgi:hypothetical protein
MEVILNARQLRFWSLMPGYARDACYKLRLSGWALHPTGSRYICPGHHRPDSDWDVMVLAGEFGGQHDIDDLLCDVEFDLKTGNYVGAGKKFDTSFYYGCLNIIPLAPKLFDAWRVATSMCIDNPCAIDRDYRVKVFKHCRNEAEKSDEERDIHDKLDAILASRGTPTGKFTSWTSQAYRAASAT